MSFQGWTPGEDHPWAAKFRTKIRIPTNAASTQQLATGFGCLMQLIMEETTGLGRSALRALGRHVDGR